MEERKVKITFVENGHERTSHSSFPSHYSDEDIVKFLGLDDEEISWYRIENE